MTAFAHFFFFFFLFHLSFMHFIHITDSWTHSIFYLFSFWFSRYILLAYDAAAAVVQLVSFIKVYSSSIYVHCTRDNCSITHHNHSFWAKKNEMFLSTLVIWTRFQASSIILFSFIQWMAPVLKINISFTVKRSLCSYYLRVNNLHWRLLIINMSRKNWREFTLEIELKFKNERNYKQNDYLGQISEH